eukprot:CAMPEP_0184294530 /NCGR_PEP_ID=MMETSP1049-20130417/5705_1 /TAXON_ID=77928 /ORGANISM="Proteomonas sulcata, Strain CCMP704" /LENGTH=178 /DNA_ID=CAMNT_0026602853 /DNA_START=281 /DNA_END=814 /DNA_ORIENTATION=-
MRQEKKSEASAARCHKQCKATCEDDCYIDEGGGLPAPDEQMEGTGEEGLGNAPNALMKQCMDQCNGRCTVPCVNSFPEDERLPGESEKQRSLRHYFNCSTQCRDQCLPVCEPAVKRRIEGIRQQRDNANHPFFGPGPEEPMPAGAEPDAGFQADGSKTRKYAQGYSPSTNMPRAGRGR